MSTATAYSSSRDVKRTAPQGPALPILAARERIVGYDVARALAIFGMVLVHFVLVMSFDYVEEGWLGQIVGFLDGRAAATFVVLAGVGLTLRAQGAGASADADSVARVRATLRRRGLFLLAAGFLNLIVWPGDILRVYGVSLLLAASFLHASGRTLWAMTLGFVAGFVALMLVLDYSKNWDWETLTYYGMWTPAGAVRNLFFDGFRTVFPWTGLLFFGMWIGRRDLRAPAAARRWVAAAVIVVVVTELASRVLVRWVRAESAMPYEDAVALFGTESMPPLPLFLISAGATAVAVIAASVRAADLFRDTLPVRALATTGQMAFTWYIAHIFLGLGTVIVLGPTEDQPLAVGLGAGLAFFALAAVLSLLWRRRFRHGPLEWVMRRVAG